MEDCHQEMMQALKEMMGKDGSPMMDKMSGKKGMKGKRMMKEEEIEEKDWK